MKAAAVATLAAALLAGCMSPRVAMESKEAFDSDSTYSRTYAATDVQACEAARRTLLSQGYIIGSASGELVRGRKSFQPSADSHVEVEFNVVCAKEGYLGRRAIAFVNAVQESYTVKKSSNSASLGLPAFGAVSVPLPASDEALVKVGSLTISSTAFYDRFFLILDRYLAGDRGQLIPPQAASGAALDPPAAVLHAVPAASAATPSVAASEPAKTP